MSTLYNGSICLSDIPKDKITKSEKNGKSYLNFNLWVNDEKDQYGNIGSINVSQSKEEREIAQKKLRKLELGRKVYSSLDKLIQGKYAEE